MPSNKSSRCLLIEQQMFFKLTGRIMVVINDGANDNDDVNIQIHSSVFIVVVLITYIEMAMVDNSKI